MIKDIEELFPTAENEIIKKVALLTCGTELLMGQIVNTNAVFLAKKIQAVGLTGQYQLVVGDNMERLSTAIRDLWKVADCIILTGGLGPTEDDISMECAAKTAGVELLYDDEAAKSIEEYFARTKREVTKNNYKQAYLPAPPDGFALPNKNGTAPGAIFRTLIGNQLKHLILLPGPPLENKLMFETYVQPYLQSRSQSILRNKFIRLIGIGESVVVTVLADLIEAQTNPTIAPYCSTGQVKLRLTQNCQTEQDVDLISPLLKTIRERLGQYIYSEDDEDLPLVIKRNFLAENITLGLAESCTAGMVASELAAVPGISDIFKGSIVAYSSETKINVLGVEPELIAEHGAVSAACAQAMAVQAKKILKVDVAAAVTGYAGPDSTAKHIDPLTGELIPVGTVYIAVAKDDKVMVEKCIFNGTREKIRNLATINLLALIWRSIRDEA